MSINQKAKGRYVRINRNITAPMVRVTKDGANLGIMPIQKAQDEAYREGLDLVEIVPEAKPPVCSIMDFGKWKFDEKKKEKEQKSKQKSVDHKAIRLRPVSSDHDVGVKIEQLKKFLLEKRTVFVNIRFKNREMAHKENGKKIMDRIIESVVDIAKSEMPRFEGTTLSVRIFPK